MMEQKYKFTFTERNIQDSVAYMLVTKYNIEPSILRAEVDENGYGVLILKLKGDDANVNEALQFLDESGIIIEKLGKHITRDKNKCFNCGACVSVCPTRSFSVDPETFEIHLNIDTCIACGGCLSACSTKAVTLSI